jgi:hypothetical protein
MDKVYSNKFLNISATGAKDSSQGLFTHRNGELEVLPTIFSCPASSGWFPASKDVIVVDSNLFHREINDSVLNSRGWVFQERWLSPRLLHFGIGQIFWECRQKFLCERFPVELPGVFDWVPGLKQFDVQSPYSRRDQKQKKAETARGDVCALKTRDKLWREIMKGYSDTCLSFAQDRVVALSGVAKVLQEAFDDQYVAGFWRCGLEYQLAWNLLDEEGANFQKSHIYLAPTWSWLSAFGSLFS